MTNKEDFLKELDHLTVEKVRQNLAIGIYSELKAKIAEAWLKQKEYQLLEAIERSKASNLFEQILNHQQTQNSNKATLKLNIVCAASGIFTVIWAVIIYFL